MSTYNLQRVDDSFITAQLDQAQPRQLGIPQPFPTRPELEWQPRCLSSARVCAQPTLCAAGLCRQRQAEYCVCHRVVLLPANASHMELSFTQTGEAQGVAGYAASAHKEIADRATTPQDHLGTIHIGLHSLTVLKCDLNGVS